MHNANVFFALCEISFLGGIPMILHHISLAPLYGLCYILFTYTFLPHALNDTSHVGIQYIYFFFDTTVPGYFVTYAMAALLVVLLLFYLLFCSSSWIIDTLTRTCIQWVTTTSVTKIMMNDTNRHHNKNNNISESSAKEDDYNNMIQIGCTILIHVVFVIAVSSAVMRFRD
jgi:hypothetical protein